MKRATSQKKTSVPAIRPISKTTISDEIVEQIMSLIERGDLQPGQRLPSERELCVQFGTGRSSLREALRCLSIVGVLHARVGEGTTVAVDSGRFLDRILKWRFITEQQNIVNLMEVRIALEGLTAASVALKGTADDLNLLQSLLKEMSSAQNDPKLFTTLDLEFHITLARASGNTLVADMITMIRGQVAKALSRALEFPNARPLSLSEHNRIIQKIREKDSEGARNAMHLHLQSALDRYKNVANTKLHPVTKTRKIAKSSPPRKDRSSKTR
jgi:GntR family transcriptional regulator, transcriptional repressor for pyruvate dehydrogenase complex